MFSKKRSTIRHKKRRGISVPHFAANSPKKYTLQEKLHNSRKKIFTIIIGFLLAFFALITVGGTISFYILSADFNKNILLVNSNLDGKSNVFLFASFSNYANNNVIELVEVVDTLQVLPLSLVLEDSHSKRLRQIQASLQTGVFIDDIWIVDSIEDYDQQSQQFLIEAWKQNQPFSFSNQWWQMYVHLLRSTITVASVSDRAQMAALDVTRSGSKQARQCSLAVVNTTNKSGVASFLTTYLEKKGVVVVRVTDNSAQLDTSRIVVSEESEACAEVVSILKYLQPEKATVSFNQEVANDYRASAVFFLGKDISELQEEW
jgi:hypothetical protein